MKIRYALCQMPLPNDNVDEILYSSADGRELDDRAETFAKYCIKTLKDLDFYNIFKNKSVLDVGCGKGYLLSMLPALTKAGIDPQISAKKNRLPGINIKTGYIKDIKAKFDIVMSWHVIEHVNDPFMFLMEIKDHIRKGGFMIIATPNASSIFAQSENWRCKESFHRYLLTKKQLKEMISDLGFEILKTATWGGFPAPRKWYQNILNKIAKYVGQGDVQIIIARRGI